MTRSRGPRVLRGLAAASIATFVALLSHVAAGGGLPGPIGILLPWLLAVLICIALAGRRLSVWRLGFSVVASQGLFHVLFVLGAGPVDGSATVGHVHGTRGMALESSGVAHGDIGMWIAHVIAGVATIALLHRGELAVRALVSAGAELAVVFTTRFVRNGFGHRTDAVRLRLPAAMTADRLRPLGWDPLAVARRGPPVGAVSPQRPRVAW
jgi:hypothetical protein